MKQCAHVVFGHHAVATLLHAKSERVQFCCCSFVLFNVANIRHLHQLELNPLIKSVSISMLDIEHSATNNAMFIAGNHEDMVEKASPIINNLQQTLALQNL